MRSLTFIGVVLALLILSPLLRHVPPAPAATIKRIARKKLVWIPTLSVLVLAFALQVRADLIYLDEFPLGEPSYNTPKEYLRVSLKETTPELQWTPDGAHIVFAFTDLNNNRTERRLHIAATDGSDVFHITSPDEIVFSPSISPDGSRVVYSTDRGGYRAAISSVDGSVGSFTARMGLTVMKEGYRIEISSLDGSNKLTLTDELGKAVSPVWSPNGDRIAFVRGWERRNWHLSSVFVHDFEGIYTVRPDGSDIRKVVDTNLEYFGSLSWSPDGQFLVFWGRNAAIHDETAVAAYTVKADGSRLTRLFDTSIRHRTDVSPLAWSPDGREIAFWKSEDGLAKLYAIEFDSLEPRVIASPAIGYESHGLAPRRTSWSPISWSPDGSMILFSVRSSASYGTLYIVNADGSDLRAVRGERIYSAWSPDGSRIANVVPPDSGYADSSTDVLYTVDPDGSNVSVLARKIGRSGLEAVGPDQRPSAGE